MRAEQLQGRRVSQRHHSTTAGQPPSPSQGKSSAGGSLFSPLGQVWYRDMLPLQEHQDPVSLTGKKEKS